MIHVTLASKEGRRDRWEIRVEGERWRDVHRTIFGSKPCFPPCQKGNDIQSIFDEYEYRRVKNYVLWLISKRSYHSEQLFKMLRERLVQEKTMQRVKQELQAAGFLNDEAWLKSFLQIQGRKYGLPILLSKLRSKGLSAETLRSIVDNVRSPEEEHLAIRNLLEKRYRSIDLKDYKVRRRVFAVLMRKGFSYERIQEVLKENAEL